MVGKENLALRVLKVEVREYLLVVTRLRTTQQGSALGIEYFLMV